MGAHALSTLMDPEAVSYTATKAQKLYCNQFGWLQLGIPAKHAS